MKTISKFALLTLLGLCNFTHAQVSNIDIVGIRTGMTVDEVKLAVNKHNPELFSTMKLSSRLKNLKNYDRSQIKSVQDIGFDYSVKFEIKDKEIIEVTFTSMKLKARSIDRVVFYKPSVSQKKFVSTFESKYPFKFPKDPNNLTQPISNLEDEWYIDRGGFITSKESIRNDNRCKKAVGSQLVGNKCNGIFVDTNANTDIVGEERWINRFSMSLYDQGLLIQDQIDYDTISQAEKRSILENNRARSLESEKTFSPKL